VFARESNDYDGYLNICPLPVNHSHPYSSSFAYLFGTLYLHSQISKDQAQFKGRLISKFTETSSLNPQWLVAFDDESWDDVDMYESSFGQILGNKATVTEPADDTNNKNKKEKTKQTVAVLDTPKTTTAKRHGSPVTASAPNAVKTKTPAVSPSEMEQQAAHNSSNSNSDSSKNSTKSQKQISFQTVREQHLSDDSSTLLSDAAKGAAGISSREQRSKRRQAAIMEEVAQQPVQEPPTKKKKVTGQYNNGKEEVVKIQMLTGTLYLYKGLRRRAEFIRKY
jgi:hypothetical protein